METKSILKQINKFQSVLKFKIINESLSDDLKDILQMLSLSGHWIYYNIIFAEQNIDNWKEDGKIIKDLKREFKKSPDYPISKIEMDKSLVCIYSHFYIVTDSGSRLSFPTLKLRVNSKYIENLYKHPYECLKSCINNNRTCIQFDNNTLDKITEVRNFRDNLIHYHTWFSTVIPSEGIEILTSKLYRGSKGINFWEDKNKSIIFTIRDFKLNIFEKYGENFRNNELINLKETIIDDFENIKIFVNDIVSESILNFDSWFYRIKKFY